MTTIFSALSAVNDLLNNSNGVDVVGIFDADLKQVFINARPLKAEVRPTSMVMKHPVENGTMIADNHIINPIDINLPLIIKSEFFNSVYGQIEQAYQNATLLSVQTRTRVYRNMIISDMPHQEDADMFDAILMRLHFVEVLSVTPTVASSVPLPANFSPENPQDSDTVPTGFKYPAVLSSSNIAAVTSLLEAFAYKKFIGI